MEDFFDACLLFAPAIILAVGSLHLIYSMAGTDFGFNGLTRNIILILFITAAQAGIYLFFLSLPTPQMSFFPPLGATYVFYKFSHYDSMSDKDLAILVLVNFCFILVIRFLFHLYAISHPG